MPQTVHLVYPHGSRISTPDAIGRRLAEGLGDRYDVRLYDWDETRLIWPGPDDALVGHPHPAPWTIFRRSSRLKGWRRVIGLSPYTHGDPAHVAYVDRVVRRCDLYLAITGPYWFDSVASSPFAHWVPKLVQMDLAVDRSDFPPVKTSFNERGRRRIVYIGHSWPMKNPDYLAEIARRLDGVELAWIGDGPVRIAGFDALGSIDFADPAAQELVAGFDFMLTVGNSDPNPTTVLEAMAWGLVPVCTPESGYVGFEGIPNVPLDDAEAAAKILRTLLTADESQLRRWQETNWRLLDERFAWHRFVERVVDAIESDQSPPLERTTLARTSAVRLAMLRSPYAPFRGPAVRVAIRPPRRLLRGVSAGARAARAARYAAKSELIGSEFARYGRRFGVELLLRGDSQGIEYLLTPVNIVRYFEFSFAAEALPAAIGRALDVGSPRLFSFYLAGRRGAEIDMANPDPNDAVTTLRLARRARLHRVRVVQQTIADMPSKPGAYDCVWSISVVEHVHGEHGDTEAMRRIWELVRPGGTVVVTVPVDRAYRIETRDVPHYGMPAEPLPDGGIFFQRVYDAHAIEERLLACLDAEPFRIAWFGERHPGHFAEYEERWHRHGHRVTVDDPRDIVDNYREYGSWEDMPGFGVCGIALSKPTESAR